ncbi:U4/U6.U5 tri-snRNP-associated protein 1 [Smittium culicis]|uniref:U4/U6.U5 tri-snRNP-associated protein 1 n=1 Tax=Smittium culicis TaxID=133412 RepID=A0A1R1YLZ3_9FUNG|nr:U4/U6.U5 tri-snRNP-associated protein 1 [Smittium culicis]
MADEISLSIEETNKLRISLGLKPLSVGNDSKTDTALENFKKLKDEQESSKRKLDLKDRIEQSKIKRESIQKLDGKGIADIEPESVDDAFEWVKNSRQRQKDLTEKSNAKKKKLSKEDHYLNDAYTSENLKGLQVSHNINEIEQGEEEILILKDQTITELEELGDELQSEKLVEKNRLTRNAELKKHLKEHGTFGKGYDDLASGISYVDSNYLKLDDDTENETVFKLGEGGIVNSNEYSNPNDKIKELNKNKIEFSLNDIQQSKQADEYYTAQEVSNLFKKKKKKQQKVLDKVNSNKLPLDSNIEGYDDDMSIPSKSSKPKKSSKKSSSRKSASNPSYTSKARSVQLASGWEEDLQASNDAIKKNQIKEFYQNSSNLNFIDDDELQEAVSKTRRKKLEFNLNIESLNEINSSAIDGVENQQDIYGLVLSTTTEFASNVGKVDLLGSASKPSSAISQGNNIDLNSDLDDLPDNEEINEISREQTDLDDTSAINIEIDNVGEEFKIEEPNTGIEEEPLIGSGIASALNFLLNKGIVKPVSEEEKKLSQDQAQKQRWLLDSKKRELLRKKEQDHLKKLRKIDAESKRGVKKSKTGYSTSSATSERRLDSLGDADLQRLQDSERSEREYFREQEELMKNYKPVVKLEYTDEHGRILNEKQAFKHFAHQFHGVFPGKKKTDKILEKIKREKELEQLNSTEHAVQQGEIWDSNRKKQNSAHVVLNVGSKPGLNGNLIATKKN